jgi:hypothetical protein
MKYLKLDFPQLKKKQRQQNQTIVFDKSFFFPVVFALTNYHPGSINEKLLLYIQLKVIYYFQMEIL